MIWRKGKKKKKKKHILFPEQMWLGIGWHDRVFNQSEFYAAAQTRKFLFMRFSCEPCSLQVRGLNVCALPHLQLVNNIRKAELSSAKISRVSGGLRAGVS